MLVIWLMLNKSIIITIISKSSYHTIPYHLLFSFVPLSLLSCVHMCAGGVEDGVLWIAMAGTHQIWALFLEDGKLPKGR